VGESVEMWIFVDLLLYFKILPDNFRAKAKRVSRGVFT
jgi:hypothetical protein